MSIKNTIVTSGIWKLISPPWRAMKKQVRLMINKKIINNIVKDNTSETDTAKKIFFCGQCESSNMGDMAQTYCTRLWLKEYYPECKIIELRSSLILDNQCDVINKIKKIITIHDFFVFQAGYNTHDLGGYEDFMHQEIMINFPNNKIIILPQTVNFNSEERKELASRIYNNHKKMLFLARDMISLDLAKEMFPDRSIIFFPDIVALLIGSYESKFHRKGINLCHRNDVERYYSDDDNQKIFEILSKFDLVNISDTIINVPNSKIYANLEKYVYKIIKQFASYRLIVTDKYHGLVFSLVSNTPVIVLKTKDHKLTSGYECFSKVFPDRVFYADNENELAEITKNILENPHYEKLDDYFKREYYDKLKKIINEWEKTNN